MSSNRRVDIGPQSRGDSDLARRLRLHQSWYRAEILNLAHGTGPRSTNVSPYGNMLTDQDAEAGKNFLTPEIFARAQERMEAGPGVERFRCTHNMLSSQPMCFNLFAPLIGDEERATRLVRAAFGANITKVTGVRIEFAPVPRSDYTGDATSFDAFIEYEEPDGAPAFLGIETKLSEPFSAKRYELENPPDTQPGFAHNRKELTCHARSPWLESSWSEVTNPRWNQLWRNHLLVQALLVHPASRYRNGTLVLVRHDSDFDIEKKARSYAEFLRDPSSFVDMPLSRLVGAWERAARDDDERLWLRKFRQRYIDLDPSAYLVSP